MLKTDSPVQLPAKALQALSALQQQARLKEEGWKTGKPDWLALAKVRREMQDCSPWIARIVRLLLWDNYTAAEVSEQWLEQAYREGRLEE